MGSQEPMEPMPTEPLTTAAAVTHKIVQNGAIEPCQILNSGKFLPIFAAKIDSNYFQ